MIVEEEPWRSAEQRQIAKRRMTSSGSGAECSVR